MNNFPSREQVQALRERYPPGTIIQLTADMQGERFQAGDIGKVTSIDDAGHIHLTWLKGGSLAIIPGVDSFREILAEPLDLNPYLDKGNLRINGYYVDACTDKYVPFRCHKPLDNRIPKNGKSPDLRDFFFVYL